MDTRLERIFDNMASLENETKEQEMKIDVLREEIEYLRSYEAIWKGDNKHDLLGA